MISRRSSKTLHDQIVEDLERRLKQTAESDLIIKPFLIYPRGEIDLFTSLTKASHEVINIYEMKTLDSEVQRAKAIDQLRRAHRYWNDQMKQGAIFLHYVFGDPNNRHVYYDHLLKSANAPITEANIDKKTIYRKNGGR